MRIATTVAIRIAIVKTIVLISRAIIACYVLLSYRRAAAGDVGVEVEYHLPGAASLI